MSIPRMMGAVKYVRLCSTLFSVRQADRHGEQLLKHSLHGVSPSLLPPDVSWSPVDHLLFFLITNAVAAPFVAAILLLLQGNYFLCQPRDREPRVLKDSWRQALLIGAGYLAYKLVAAPLVISILYLSAYQGPADRGPIDAIVAPGVFSCLFLAVACVLFSSWHHTDTKPN